MFTSRDFDRLVYTDPEKSLTDNRPMMDNIVGLDTEAYTTGVPFMFCTSKGDIFQPDDIPDALLSPVYAGCNFMLYNMKYDSGALLYHLPLENLNELRVTGKTKFDGFRYQYIRHKMMRIYKGKKHVTFWDIAQFYKSSLDRAAQTYLHDKKKSIRTKRFSPVYVRKYWRSIANYCIHDATLTARLGQYLVDKLHEFGITATTLYSCASISFKFFCDRSKVVTAWRMWNDDRDTLAFACDAYRGGKFEVTSRGYFKKAYEYDITSAYPYEISNLIDIGSARSVRTKQYQFDAVYGFLRCRIHNPKGLPLPCGTYQKGQGVIYYAGNFHTTITKTEYDFCVEHGIEVEIFDGVWLFVDRIRYPYRSAVDFLFKIKDEYKGRDALLYSTAKICLNSFYGKFCQSIRTPEGKIKVGQGWNPVYASYITANTRIAVSRMQMEHRERCLAVHTDSVILLDDIGIPDRGVMGKFEYVTKGKALVIACGCYQIGDQCAFKGFEPKKSDDWFSILDRYYYRSTVPYSELKVESWVEACAKNHPKKVINFFHRFKKRMDLNCDNKRSWERRVKSRDLLSGMENSYPKILVENTCPDYWQ